MRSPGLVITQTAGPSPELLIILRSWEGPKVLQFQQVPRWWCFWPGKHVENHCLNHSVMSLQGKYLWMHVSPWTSLCLSFHTPQTLVSKDLSCLNPRKQQVRNRKILKMFNLQFQKKKKWNEFILGCCENLGNLVYRWWKSVSHWGVRTLSNLNKSDFKLAVKMAN